MDRQVSENLALVAANEELKDIMQDTNHQCSEFAIRNEELIQLVKQLDSKMN